MNRRQFVSMIAAILVVATGFVPASAQSEEWDLSLDQCLRLALESNLDLVSARYDPSVSLLRIDVQDGAFDINAFATAERNAYKRERRTQFETAGAGDTNRILGGIRQDLKYGADYSVQLDYTQENGANVLFEPYYQAVVTAQFNQPLLNGLGREDRAEQFLIAKNNEMASREELRRQTELTLQSVENGFWDVAAAREALSVATQSRQRAMDLLDLNRKKVEVGTLAPIEITQAEAGVASEEENVIVAQVALGDAEDELRRLMAIPPDDPRWGHQIVPVDLAEFREIEVDVDAAIGTALSHRPEIANARIDLESRQLSERAAKKRVRSRLDLNALVQPFGNNSDGLVLDGMGNPIFTPPGCDPVLNECSFVFNEKSAGEAFSEIFDRNNYFWRLQLNWSIPIGNKTAKANYRIATIDRRKSEVAITNQEQTVRVEVRRAARAVTSGGQRVVAARKNVELQQKKLEAEQKKFENGMSTSFEVLTFQNDLLDAELSRIRALVDYVKSITALERVQGTLLDARGLVLITENPDEDNQS